MLFKSLCLRQGKNHEETMEANELTKTHEKMALIRSYYAEHVTGDPRTANPSSLFHDAIWTVSTVAMAMTLIIIFVLT